MQTQDVFQKLFHFLLTSMEIGATINIGEQMFDAQKRRERHGVAAQSTAVFRQLTDGEAWRGRQHSRFALRFSCGWTEHRFVMAMATAP